MADLRRVALDELVNRPGTYFNPRTEVLLIVDDSPHLDTTHFNLDEFEAEDWALVSDEVPIDEHERDELLERFQIRYQEGVAGVDEEDEDEPEPELESHELGPED
jgi:hypothetical protein